MRKFAQKIQAWGLIECKHSFFSTLGQMSIDQPEPAEWKENKQSEKKKKRIGAATACKSVEGVISRVLGNKRAIWVGDNVGRVSRGQWNFEYRVLKEGG